MAVPAAIGAGGLVLSNLIGGKNAKRAQDKALDAQTAQFDWVKSIFGERKDAIANVSKWAEEQGLTSPDAMFARMDKATAASRARDSKNLVNALFRQGGYHEGETAAENVLALAEKAHAEDRDKAYLGYAIDSFGRRLALATAPYETGLVGQTLQAGQVASTNAFNAAANERGAAGQAIGDLAGAWSRYEAYKEAQRQAQANVQPVTGPVGQLGSDASGGGGQGMIGLDTANLFRGFSQLPGWG